MMLRTLPRSSRRAAGFTLIELLVAVALLAILAVLSWRGLDAVIQSRERLVTESDELRSLTLALAQLEEDLLGTWPVKNLGGGIRPIRVVQD
ncbi:MAG: prepilin-type N-terminal cleavage/methylation domain-containing protein, partial [Lautropia mirabilis]|nr:prepilin-type N-terminal cleavage/methylation domain-containing protein [Lautropia mirabilis]